MKSRLDALLRQRELLREHTLWLDAEIAHERASAGTAAPVAPVATTSAPQAPPDLATTVVALPEADVKGLHNDVRRGCLLYFLLAAAALGGLIAYIYWKYEPVAEEPSGSPATELNSEAPTPTAPR